MKDEEKAEEMAEEWVKQEYPTLQITKVAQRYIKAFLAGLKAGRPQWHDLRKDPNDLPKGDGGSVSRSVLKEDGMEVHYNFWEKQWETSAYVRMKEPPIAWCEIPTFDKE